MTRPRTRGPRPPVDALHPAVRLRRRAGADDRARRGRRTSTTCDGKRYLDGLSGLFVVQAGHGRQELADAAAKQAARAGLLPALVLRAPEGGRAGRPAGRPGPGRPEPGLLHHRRLRGGRVGLEARPLLLQAGRQAHQAQGDLPPHRLPRHLDGCAVDHRAARQSRRTSSRWCPPASGCPTPTSTARPPAPPGPTAPTPRRSAGGPPTGSRRPSCSRARTPSPRCSWSRCRTPAAASRRRPATSSGSGRSATRYDVLLVSDEVICAFGRLGEYFGATRYGYQPDIITCAKGMTSGLRPARRDDRLGPAGRAVPARTPTGSPHGVTFGGHPVASAVALANLDIFAREDLNGHVRANEGAVPVLSGASAATCRSSATSAATATSTASSWSRTRRPRRRSTTTSPSGCCAGSCPRPCSTPGSTAGPTTAATRWSSSPRR